MLKLIKLEYCFARFSKFKYKIQSTDIGSCFIIVLHKLKGDLNYSAAIQYLLGAQNTIYTYSSFIKDIFSNKALTIEKKIRKFERI